MKKIKLLLVTSLLVLSGSAVAKDCVATGNTGFGAAKYLCKHTLVQVKCSQSGGTNWQPQASYYDGSERVFNIGTAKTSEAECDTVLDEMMKEWN